jgi:SAM-dependent methyltransferase
VPFDLINARFILVHLPERGALLRRLGTFLAPGGHLVVTEAAFASWLIDDLTPGAPALRAYREHAQALGWPLEYGHELPRAFEAMGLAEVRATAWSHFHRPGDLGSRLIAANLASQEEALLAGGALTHADVEDAANALLRGDRGSYYVTVWTTVGRAP